MRPLILTKLYLGQGLQVSDSRLHCNSLDYFLKLHEYYVNVLNPCPCHSIHVFFVLFFFSKNNVENCKFNLESDKLI